MKKTNSSSRAKAVLKATQIALKGLESSLSSINKAVRLILKREGDVVVTGIGKSRFIGEKFTATLTSLGVRAFFLHPTEALHGDLGALSSGDVLIALSYSGESKEVVAITRYAKKNFKVPVVAITGDSKSSLGALSDVVVGVSIRDEGSPNKVAPMASTTATLVACDMIAASMVGRDFKLEDFATYHPGGSLGLKLKRVEEFMHKGKSLPKVHENQRFVEALKEISDKKKGITAVVGKRGEITGVITDGDIRRFVLKNQDVSKSKVGEVMTLKPKHLKSTDSLQDALIFMEKYKITSVFVVDKSNKLVGVLHIHDIIENAVI